jgi:hypothetical protein
MEHLLDFQARRYDQFDENCTCFLVAAREQQKNPQMLHQDDLLYAVISVHFYTYLSGMLLVYIPMYSTI